MSKKKARAASKSRPRRIKTQRISTALKDKDVQTKSVTPVLGKYITRNQNFVAYLQEVRRQIDAYVQKPSVKRPLNIFLAAPPGSGKSFLIKQLISSIDSPLEVSFEETYIASLEDVTELYSIFQRVQSVNLEGKMPVVFFDEIDTKIGNGNLYPKFLAPMWDGTFYVGKEKFYLGKSIFFFAGSTLSLDAASAQILKDVAKTGATLSYDDYAIKWRERFDDHCKKQKDKLPDFMDRIDAVIRIPPICKELLDDKLDGEYEDLACMLILKHFPSVKFIGKLALKTIVDILKNSPSMRAAEKAIFSSQLEEPEIFDLSCLPSRLRKLNASDAAGLVDGKEKAGWEIVVAQAP